MSSASSKPISFLLRFFFKKYKGAILTGIAAIIVVDLAELAFPILLKRVVDAASGEFNIELIHSTLIYVSLVIFCQVICRYLWRISLARGAMSAGADLRKLFSKQIFEVTFSFFERKKVGDLMTLATSDVENMRFALGPGLISIIDSFFYCISIPIAMYFLAPAVMLRMLIPVIGIPICVILLQEKISIFSRSVQERIGKLGTQTQEAVSGVRLAKIYGAQENLEARLNQKSNLLNQSQVKLSKTQAAFAPLLEFFLSVSLIILFGLGSTLSIGTLVAMQRYLQKLMWPMSALGMAIVYFQKAKASGREFYGFLEEERVEKIEGLSAPLPIEINPGVPLIEARNLNFRVIHNLSFQVYPGEWLGIEGRVASGKSTLFSLFLKFYDPSPNQLFVNGRDILLWQPNEIRHWFTSVLQDPYLFHGSVRSNLEVGNDIELFEAMETAHVHGAIADLRFDEELGEKGSGLSGGQKQTIAIARALRKPAPILLLDDPLSSVDFDTSKKVLKALVQSLRRRKKTVLFISHHPEHLSFCDRVIRL